MIAGSRPPRRRTSPGVLAPWARQTFSVPASTAWSTGATRLQHWHRACYARRDARCAGCKTAPAPRSTCGWHAPSASMPNAPTTRTSSTRCALPMWSASARCKVHRPYEFGVKVSVAVTHRHGLVVRARAFPGNPYDGHTLAEQMEQTNTLLQDIGVRPTTAVVDLGFRGVDRELAPVQVVHRGKSKTLTRAQRTWLKPSVAPTVAREPEALTVPRTVEQTLVLLVDDSNMAREVDPPAAVARLPGRHRRRWRRCAQAA